MSAEGHTPGPWFLNGLAHTTTGGNRFASGVIHIGAGESPKTLVAKVEWRELSTIECKANARLIAAAPDLLAALQWLADEYELLANRGHCSHANLKQSRAAISKATQS